MHKLELTPRPAEPAPAPASKEAPSPTLAQILAGWQAAGKIEIIPLSVAAAELTQGRLSPLVEETTT